MFRDGYRKTYTKAMERNIPLVSVKWVEDCKLANKILNPIDYLPIDIEKYSTPKLKLNTLVSLKFLLFQFSMDCLLIGHM